MTLGALIKEYRDSHGMNMQDFANLCGLSKAYISILERNRNPKSGKPPIPSLETIRAISTVIGKDFNDVIAILDGDQIVSLKPEPASNKFPSNILPMPNFVKKPRLGVIACGEPILADQNIQSYDDIPDWVKCDFTLVCKGDSMVGAHIMDGAVVCIRSQPEVEDGQIAAVIVDDMESEATLKRVKYFPDHIELRPENPSFRPLSFWDEDMNKVRVIGKAVYCINTL